MLVQLNRYINDGNANYCGVRVTRSLVLCERFVDLCLSVCAFSLEDVIQRMTDNTMVKGNITKAQTMNYKILHGKLMIEQHEPH
jgi:hypothetical protein